MHLSAVSSITATVCCTCQPLLAEENVDSLQSSSALWVQSPVLHKLHWLRVHQQIMYNWQRSSKGAYMGWRLLIWLMTVCLSQVLQADTFCLLMAGLSLTQQWGLYLAHLWSLVLLCGPEQFGSKPSLCVRFFADFCRETKDIFVWTDIRATADNLFCATEVEALLLLLFFGPLAQSLQSWI